MTWLLSDTRRSLQALCFAYGVTFGVWAAAELALAPAPDVTDVVERPGAGAVAARVSAPPSPSRVTPPSPAIDELRALARRVVPPEVDEGDLRAPLEDPHGTMDAFYRALLLTASGEDGAVTRIGHWSDSSLAADGPSGSMRRRLQAEFGDAGHGWILADPGSRWYRHQDVQHDSHGWRKIELVGNRSRDGRYGLGGVTAVGRSGAWFRVGTVRRAPVGDRVGRFLLHYMAGPGAGRLELRIDGKRAVTLDAREAEEREALYEIAVPDGHHRLDVRAVRGRRVRVFGVAMERATTGVVYDSFGIVGAKIAKLLRIEEGHLREQLQLRAHDLMMLQFGGNSLQDPHLDYGRYRERQVELLWRFRTARPEAACLVVGTHDHGVRGGRRRIETDPRLTLLLSVQRAAAFEAGCAWYSHTEAMEDDGGVAGWRDKKWISGDLRHLTRRGARRIARFLNATLMDGFGDFVRNHAGPDSVAAH